MKRKKKQKQEPDPITEQLEAAIDLIENNPERLSKIDRYRRDAIFNVITRLGFSLVKTQTLTAHYTLQEFCENNGLEMEACF